jgi:hypothetical protein
MFVCVKLLLCKEAGGGGGEARDTESKTRTPHKDVGKNHRFFFADLTIPVFTGFRGLFTVFRNSHFFVDLNQLLPISEINGNLCAGFLTFPDKFWDSWGIGHNYVNRKSIFYEYRKI